MATKSISVWVKAEPFSYGTIPVAPHPRLNSTNIRKIVIYSKNKGSAGFPRLSYSMWQHIACNKLHLSEDLAWMYFHTCQFFTENPSPIECIEKDEMFALCKDQHEKNKLVAHESVNLYKFVIFLSMQQLYRMSLRTSLVAGDEWPSTSSSATTCDLDGRSTPRGGTTKSLDDHSHQLFVQNNIGELTDLISDEDSKMSGVGLASATKHLSLEAIEALGFVLIGRVENSSSLHSLHDLALLQVVQQQTGYQKATRSFPTRQFTMWLKECLIQNPFNVSACIASGTRLSWPFIGEDQKSEQSHKRGKIATNAHLVPKDHIKGNKMIIMSQVSKQTIARSSGTLEMSTVKIHRSHHSYLYLLSPLRSVTIEKCRNTTLILGPVEATVHVSGCENVTIIAPCRNLMISGSTLCTLYLLTPHRPLLLSGNDTIMLAPYHTFYASLEEHMVKAGISTAPNLWDQPLCIGPDHRDDQPVWQILPESEFYPFSVPFEMQGSTKAIPGSLPSYYQKELNKRQKQIDTWQHMVKDAGLSREQRKEFQTLVESRFHIWLSETGHKRELDSLVVPLQPVIEKR
ncbi:TBCC domain-containing protein 1-like [Physella acuta]|uniref:TBCC domain-containing protein 1-like n=1 Tax=Physella acuta TaxID=109671 RepID=UPI0027DDE3F7|nr:TBCC domain-containing protein 1-like [Physella acuta]XP_059154105.1 TBCC domain-containing protein 1-like [Physella acuta]